MSDPTARRFRSATIRDGTIRATTRSFLYGLGLDDDARTAVHDQLVAG